MIVTAPSLIVQTQGLRFAEKVDRRSYIKQNELDYSIRLVWKGQEMSHTFESQSERDTFFQAMLDEFATPEEPID